jgi:predicted nucleic acid-binding protein
LILIDSSGLFAAINEADRRHREALDSLRRAEPPRYLSPFVLAELDYFIRARVGAQAAISLLAEVARGAYRLEPFDPLDIEAARAIMERYADLRVSLADASIVVLAERRNVRDVLTLDERHFRALRVGRKQFRVLPADA